MNEKQKQALEVLNKLRYESYYEKMTKEEYFLLLEFVFPCQQVYVPNTYTDWTTFKPLKPYCNDTGGRPDVNITTSDGKHYASITTVGNSVKDINDTPEEEE